VSRGLGDVYKRQSESPAAAARSEREGRLLDASKFR